MTALNILTYTRKQQGELMELGLIIAFIVAAAIMVKKEMASSK